MKEYFFVFFIFLISIDCENIGIWPGIFYLEELFDDENIFLLEIYEPKDNQKMKIEIFLSHPSSYQIYFNYSDEIEKEEEIEKEDINKKDEIENENEDKEEEVNELIEEEETKEEKKEKEIAEKEIKEEIEKELYKEIEEELKTNNFKFNLNDVILYLYNSNFYDKSLRKLYEYPDYLIELEDEISTKKEFILNLKKNMTKIKMIIKKTKEIPELANAFCYIKYQYNEKNFKKYKFSNTLNASLINGYVDLSFKGIIPEDVNITDDFVVEYEAFLYRKNEKDNYENINHKFLPNRFCSRSGTLKSNKIKEETYGLILTGIEQNGKEQWLEVEAEVKYGDDREYFVYNLTLVYIENKNRYIPDEPDINTENKTNNNETDIDNNKINNDKIFYIIILTFAIIIILTFIIIFVIVYKKKEDKIDIDDEDFENIGLLNNRT